MESKTNEFLAPFILFALSILVMLIHPDPADCPCVNDTVSALGALCGAFLGSWMYNKLDIRYSDYSLSTAAIRFVVGSVLIIFWRLSMKSLFASKQVIEYYGM